MPYKKATMKIAFSGTEINIYILTIKSISRFKGGSILGDLECAVNIYI